MLKENFATVNKDYVFTDCTGKGWAIKKSKFAANYSPIHVSDYMSGKMSGIPSISTSCLDNPICRKRMQDGESICVHCFAAALLECRKNVREGVKRNFDLLNTEVLPLDLLPRFRNVSIVRIESFGDVASVTQVINYINIVKVNPLVTFAAWTKNASLWNEAIKQVGKPENLSLVYSSFKLNKPASPCEYFTKDGVNHFDHIFTVFDKKTCDFYGDGFVNCGARDCASCRRCYRKDNQDFNVIEQLK